MKCKKLLAAFLLGAGLCFVPVLGHGGTQEPAPEVTWVSLGQSALNVILVFLFLAFGILVLREYRKYVEVNKEVIQLPGDYKGKLKVWEGITFDFIMLGSAFGSASFALLALLIRAYSTGVVAAATPLPEHVGWSSIIFFSVVGIKKAYVLIKIRIGKGV